jgi:hypothetical protein
MLLRRVSASLTRFWLTSDNASAERHGSKRILILISLIFGQTSRKALD